MLTMATLKVKRPADSRTIKTEVVCPDDTNPMDILQGGRLVQWMDIAAAVCAQVHAENICVTASIDSVDFKVPAKLGDIVRITASITRAFTSSMEISVEASTTNIKGGKKLVINRAFFTFVALGSDGTPAPVPAVKPVTSAEKEAYQAASVRRREKHRVK